MKFITKKHTRRIRRLRIKFYRAGRKFKRHMSRYATALTGLLVTAQVYAGSSDDFSLDTIDDSVKSHLLGDVGRLIGYLLIVVIVSLVVAKKYMLALGCFLGLLVLYYTPDIIDTVFKS